MHRLFPSFLEFFHHPWIFSPSLQHFHRPSKSFHPTLKLSTVSLNLFTALEFLQPSHLSDVSWIFPPPEFFNCTLNLFPAPSIFLSPLWIFRSSPESFYSLLNLTTVPWFCLQSPWIFSPPLNFYNPPIFSSSPELFHRSLNLSMAPWIFPLPHTPGSFNCPSESFNCPLNLFPQLLNLYTAS